MRFLPELLRRDFLASLPMAASGGILAAQESAGLRGGSPSGSDLGTLYAQALEASGPPDYPLSLLRDTHLTFEQVCDRARDKVLELLHYQPPTVDPAAKVTGRWEAEDYVQERVEFATAPWFRVPAYVLIPKRYSGPRPAVVDLHSHGGMFMFGREKVMPMPEGDHPAITRYREENYEGVSTSAQLCRRGYVVIAIDAFYFGERRTVFDDAPPPGGRVREELTAEETRILNRRAGAGESTLARTLFWAGTTWPGIVHWDDIRTVDYLVQRPEVDGSRIGCLGISMGGDRTNYLAALDDRIKCAVSVGWMSTLRDMTRAHVNTHSFVHFLPGLTHFMDLPDLLGCMAPRPLLVQYCEQDALYPKAGMERSWDHLQAIYRRADAAAQLDGRFYPVPHMFTRRMQEDAFDWLDRRLQPA